MITFHVEPFIPFLAEVKPLFKAHWEELALDQDKVPLDPQFDVYLARAARGEVLPVTMREDGEMVGYFVGFIAPGLHYRTCLTCTMDIFWVKPEHRGAGGGFGLFRKVEEECRRRGVRRLFVGSKLHRDASFLFEKLGYIEVERYFSVYLGD